MPRVSRCLFSAAVLFSAAALFATPDSDSEINVATAATASPNSDLPLADCERFGRELAADITQGNWDAFLSRFDFDAFSARVTKGLALDDKEKRALMSNLNTGPNRIFKDVFNDHAAATYLRTLRVGTEQRVLLRLLTPENTFGYLAYTISKTNAGALRFTDRYDYSTAELMSDILHESLLNLWGEKLTATGNRSRSDMWQLYQQAKQYRDAIRLLKAGRYEEAIRAFSSFPEKLALSKNVFIQRIRCLQKYPNDAEYIKTLEEFEDRYPGDPSLNLILIDGNYIQKDYYAAAKNIDGLAHSLGGTDGYLCKLKASLLAIDGSREPAKQAARDGIAAEPTMIENYDLLLKFCCESIDYEDAVKVLDLIETNFPGIDMGRSLLGKSAYADFRASETFRNWLKMKTSAEQN